MKTKQDRVVGKRVAGGSILAVLMVAGVLGCAESVDVATEASAPWVMERVTALPPLPVEAVVVERRRMISDIAASGIISAAREVSLVSETQGVIVSSNFELGEAVEQGRVLLTLDTSIQELGVEEALQATVAAELNVTTNERLVASGNASQTALTQARGTLAGARARLAQARKALADRTIVVPFDGLVASKAESVNVGSYLTAGLAVARIIDSTQMEVRLSVGEREIRYIRTGAAAFVSVPAAGGGEIRAEVVAIAAGSDPQTGSFPVIVRWDQPAGLLVRAGLSARVRVPPTGAPLRLVVPSAAVIVRGDERFVLVANEDGIAERRAVNVGERQGEQVSILGGVEPGEMVIISGLRTLTHGDPVDVTLRSARGSL